MYLNIATDPHIRPNKAQTYSQVELETGPHPCLATSSSLIKTTQPKNTSKGILIICWKHSMTFLCQAIRQSLKANKKLHPEIPCKSSRFISILLSLEKIHTDMELFAAGASSFHFPAGLHKCLCTPPTSPPSTAPALNQGLPSWGTDNMHCRPANTQLKCKY